MKSGVIVAALIGVVVAVLVVGAVGFRSVLSSAAAIGAIGFVAFCLYSLAVIPILGAGWRAVTPAGPGSNLWSFTWARLVRDAAADVLPFSQVGGLILGAREATAHGLDTSLTFASTILDLTTELAAQLLYTLFGVACLIGVVAQDGRDPAAAWIAGFGLLIALTCATGFVAAQARGGEAVSFLARRWFPDAAARAQAVQARLQELYRRRAAIGLSVALHLAAWVASGLGAWIALYLIGLRIGVIYVLAIESLLYAVKSFAFVVPNAVGVQEGAYALIGPIFGLPAEAALALSLLKRARDLALGVPVLLIWQALEGGRLFRKRAPPDVALRPLGESSRQG